MIRRLLIPLFGSGLLLAAGASTVLGKCDGPNPPADICSGIVANMDIGGIGTFTPGTPTTVKGFVAGTAMSVNVSISQGERPFETVGMALNFTSAVDGTRIRVQATASGQPGLWHADVTLPSGGAWMVVAAVVEANGSASNVGINTVQVAKAPQAPPATPTTPTPPVSPATPALPIAMLVAGLGAAALLASGMRDRARRRGVGAAAGGTAHSASSERA
jgi:hypothetical protein